MICKIFITTANGQVTAGILKLQNGRLIARANAGYENLFTELVEQCSGDPESWLKSLPKKLAGSYLRAQVL